MKELLQDLISNEMEEVTEEELTELQSLNFELAKGTCGFGCSNN